MIAAIQAFPSSDGVFVEWRVDKMIQDCLGFAIYRRTGEGAPECLPTYVGFEDQNGLNAGGHRFSTEWPVQKTSWTDYGAAPHGDLRYGVVPVLKDGTDGVRVAAAAPERWSEPVTVDNPGPLVPWFNRGTIAAQWLARALQGHQPAQELEAAIGTPGNEIRDFLGGPLKRRLIEILADSAHDKREVYGCLFELNDPELINALKAVGKRAHLVIGNSTGKKDDNNTKETAANAKLLSKAKVDVTRREIAPGRYAHNKFLVICDENKKPDIVWTGSTNWTRTGLCTQNNNALEFHDSGVAQDFHEHWKLLHDTGDATPSSLARAGDEEHSRVVGQTRLSTWFAPTSKSGDLARARDLINAARQGILFLMLNPGPAGLLGPIIERASPLDGHYDPSLYIRGVLNQFPSDGDGDGDELSLLTSDGSRQNFTKDDLTKLLRPGNIDETSDWWEKELAKAGRFQIAVHSKVIVIDPSGDKPVVMTGSHNFSERASTKNDDNLVIVEGDRQLARSYAANVIGIYNTYRFRAWRNTEAGRKDRGLKRNSDWLTKRINAGWAAKEYRFWLGA